MTITLKKDAKGKFIPTPQKELFADGEVDKTETQLHTNDPFTYSGDSTPYLSNSFLSFSATGHDERMETEKRGNK